jgi:hypothetical protein
MALHWSRKPEQIARDAEFFKMAGLAFEDTAETFSTFKAVPQSIEKKPEIVAVQLWLFEKEIEV